MPSKTKTKPAEDTTDDDQSDDTVEITFNGTNFTVPKDRDVWSMESELALYEARATGLSFHWLRWVELGLGPKQWAQLLDTLTNRGDLVAFTQTFVTTVFAECTG